MKKIARLPKKTWDHAMWHEEARQDLQRLIDKLKRRRHASDALDELYLRLSALDEHCQKSLEDAEPCRVARGWVLLQRLRDSVSG
jgi:exonuclease VII small subunit